MSQEHIHNGLMTVRRRSLQGGVVRSCQGVDVHVCLLQKPLYTSLVSQTAREIQCSAICVLWLLRLVPNTLVRCQDTNPSSTSPVVL
jgi:hypothetical protein